MFFDEYEQYLYFNDVFFKNSKLNNKIRFNFERVFLFGLDFLFVFIFKKMGIFVDD